MADFNRKKSYRKYIYSPFTLLLLFIVLGLLLKALWGLSIKERLSSDYLKQEQAELNRMNDRKRELAQTIDYLKTDQGVESELRSKFRVVKEGEEVAVIVGDDDATTTAPTVPPPTFFEKVLHFIGL